VRRIHPLCALALLLPLCSCTGPTHDQQHAYNEAKLVAEGIVALKVGAVAPPLSLSGTGAKSLSLPLSSLPGDPLAGWTALYFFPAPDTPNTAKHLGQLSAQYDALALDGISVYALTKAPLEALNAFAAETKTKVPLLADPGGEACVAYAALKPGGTYPQRTTVLISPDGRIALYRRGLVLPAELRKAAGLAAPVEKAK